MHGVLMSRGQGEMLWPAIQLLGFDLTFDLTAVEPYHFHKSDEHLSATHRSFLPSTCTLSSTLFDKVG